MNDIEILEYNEDEFIEKLKVTLFEDNVNIRSLVSHPDTFNSYFDEFEIVYEDFTKEKMKLAIKHEIEKMENEEKKQQHNELSVVPTETNIKPYRKIESTPIAEIKDNKLTYHDLKKMIKIGAYKPEMFEQIIKNVEIMATEDYLAYSDYNIKDAKGNKTGKKKRTWFIKAEVKRDVLTTMFNFKVHMELEYIKIDLDNGLKDTKVICHANIYDDTRNGIVEGVVASEYVVKHERDDEGNFIPTQDSEYPEEKAQTRALGRLMDMIVPSYIWKKIRDFVYDKFYKTQEDEIKEKSKTVTTSDGNKNRSSGKKKSTRKKSSGNSMDFR
jgi:hypothetical protein